jgi:hypothetical protein
VMMCVQRRSRLPHSYRTISIVAVPSFLLPLLETGDLGV